MAPEVIAALIAGIGGILTAVISLSQTQTLKKDIYLTAAKEITERRLRYYSRLWQLMSVAKPSNPDIDTMEKRISLEKQMSEWYFQFGAGMLMSSEARQVFVECKALLKDPSVASDVVVGRLSTFRSLLKSDIRGLYDDPDKYKE